MTDALASATASFEVLQRQLGECATIVEALQKSVGETSLPMSAVMVGQHAIGFLVNYYFFFLLFTF